MKFEFLEVRGSQIVKHLFFENVEKPKNTSPNG
jgi:hypothetical protein